MLRVVRLVFAALLLLVACRSDVAERPVAPVAVAPAQAHTHEYSPFVVHMHGEDLPFGVISFKDVGMSLPEEERPFVYESLAQSLTLQLEQDANLSSEVRHTVEILDPANHAFCEGRHIYVDLWEAQTGWGYSLWSGCGEDDRFAHRELASRVPAAPAGDHLASLDPLVRDIADSLRDAISSGCFTRRC